jgi:hypothetical protein
MFDLPHCMTCRITVRTRVRAKERTEGGWKTEKIFTAHLKHGDEQRTGKDQSKGNGIENIPKEIEQFSHFPLHPARGGKPLPPDGKNLPPALPPAPKPTEKRLLCHFCNELRQIGTAFA